MGARGLLREYRSKGLAGELGLPVVIHCREAFEDCMGILADWGRADVPVVFHCFSGTRQEAQQVTLQGLPLL